MCQFDFNCSCGNMCKTHNFIFASIIIMSLWHNMLADYYTSIAELEYVFEAESFLIENIEILLKRMEEKNQKIDNFLKTVESLKTRIDVDAESYYGDPINAFKTINRMVTDWKRFVYLNVNDSNIFDAYNETIMTLKDSSNFTKEDLKGATGAIIRLQDTYALSTADLVKGILNGKKVSEGFSSNDCFHIGRMLYEMQEYQYSVEWLLMARAFLHPSVDSYKDFTVFPGLQDISILELLPAALFEAGNLKLAYKLNNELLEKYPQNVYGQQNKLIFDTIKFDDRNGIQDDNEDDDEDDDDDNDDDDDDSLQTQFESPATLDLYKRVCRGEVKRKPSLERHLRCRYTHNNVPFRFLAPFKMEQQSVEPFVAIYHDAIFDSEITKIISTSKEHLERSQVGQEDQKKVSTVRTSKTSWLEYQNCNLSSLLLRLDHITGLSTETVEQMQVVNYGIGGHYEPHNDFLENYTFGNMGNRILTALFYINHVELGGSTVFPFLRLAAPPTRGSLLVWYNLHASSESDYRMMHAGCPVLKGSKWIANVWFHEGGQEFRRPCGLQRDDAKSIKYQNL